MTLRSKEALEGIIIPEFPERLNKKGIGEKLKKLDKAEKNLFSQPVAQSMPVTTPSMPEKKPLATQKIESPKVRLLTRRCLRVLERGIDTEQHRGEVRAGIFVVGLNL